MDLLTEEPMAWPPVLPVLVVTTPLLQKYVRQTACVRIFVVYFTHLAEQAGR